MRKNIITLFIALLTAISVQAQENTYNMVIEMANGTKITIGPNDIRNITFNDGKLVVTGQSLQEWMENVAKKVEVEDLRDQIFSFTLPSVVFVNRLADRYGTSEYDGAATANNLMESIDINSAIIYEINEWRNDTDARIVTLESALESVNNNLKEDIGELRARINLLENKVAELESKLSQ